MVTCRCLELVSIVVLLLFPCSSSFHVSLNNCLNGHHGQMLTPLRQRSTTLCASYRGDNDIRGGDLSDSPFGSTSSHDSLRRQILGSAGIILLNLHSKSALAAGQYPKLSLNPGQLSSSSRGRAVGSGEEACRLNNNCLEVGEWDGAVGWSWGARDRCDPTNPLCGSDGKLLESPLTGQPVPKPVSRITHVVDIDVEIGRAESGTLRLGLYGELFPELAQQLVDLCSVTGLSTLPKDEGTLGLTTQPVSLAVGGVVSSITPSLTASFGIPSQANAYGRSRGISRTDNFTPQPRPPTTFVRGTPGLSRRHDAAGLLSVPARGLGYNSDKSNDDSAFAQAFLITAAPAPSLDRDWTVVGQVLDPTSMAFLERLSNLPTQKGLLGVIPGQSSGPPLLKVIVSKVRVMTDQAG